jgi:hypothetical protein
MFPLGALLAGGAEGYQEGAARQLQIDDLREQMEGRKAFGRTLMSMGLLPGGQPVGPQPPQPGQPSMPMQRGFAVPMAPGPAPQQPPMSAMPGQQPPMAPGPMAPGQQPQRPVSPLGGGTGMLDWRQVAQMVTQANPGAKPEVVAAAVNQFIPLMNQQSQLEWRMLSLQLAQQRAQGQLELGHERLGETERYHEGLQEDRAANRELGRERLGETERYHAGQREDRAATRGDIQKRFDTREGRLQQQLEATKDYRSQVLEQRKEQLRQQALRFDRSMDARSRASIVQQWREARRTHDAYMRNKISAMSNLTGADKKQMLDQLDKDWWADERQMQDSLKESGASVPQGSPEAQPQGPPTGSTPIPPDKLKELKNRLKGADQNTRQEAIDALKSRGFSVEGL